MEDSAYDQAMSEVQVAPPLALNLVVIQSRNILAAKQFYECLGLSLKLERHGRGPEHYAAEVGASVFEIYPSRGEDAAGNVRIGFLVPSLESALGSLSQQSAQVLKEPHDSPWGRRAVVKDPDGNRVELTERS